MGSKFKQITKKFSYSLTLAIEIKPQFVQVHVHQSTKVSLTENLPVQMNGVLQFFQCWLNLSLFAS